MFIRRTPQKTLKWLKEFCYPDMGYIRTLKYMYHRIVRLSDGTTRIAAGLAIGSAVSFSPLVGTHFLQALGLAWLVRANYLAAMIGTFLGNPWTFPFLWLTGYYVGSSVFGAFGVTDFAELPDNLTIYQMIDLFWAEPLTLFLPWMLGGYICAIMFAPLSFLVSYYIVNTTKKARRRRRIKKLRKKLAPRT